MTAVDKYLEETSKFKTNREKLQYIVDCCPSAYKHVLEDSRFKFLLDWIVSCTPLLDSSQYELKTRIYWALHGIQDFPKCEVDGKPMIGVNVSSVQQGYAVNACCKACHNKIAYERRKKKMQERYGVDNPFQLESVVQKIRSTNITRYGNACAANGEAVRKKIDESNMKKYGVKSYSSTQECREKVRQANLAKFGVDSPFKCDAVKEKSMQTCLTRYGVKHPLQSAAIRSKAKESLIAKYGENYKLVLWGRHGNISQSKRAYNDYICKSKDVIPLFSEQEYVDARLASKNDFEFKCKHCGKTFSSYWDNGMAKSCPYCKITTTKTSSAEQELYAYVLELMQGKCKVKHNCRTVIESMELDVYVPDKKLALEYDGLYWHSDEMQADKTYHLRKTAQCQEKGVHLVHVFENEWLYNKDIVKSRIRDLLGVHDRIVYARKCEVREVDSKASKQFQDDNHIQGSINAPVSLGLYCKDKLVSLMTFGKCRFDKKHEWELLRFCSKCGCHIPGAASKLLKHFEKAYKPKSLVSYADRRWSQGKLYRALGFKLDHVSPPNYWYFKTYTQMHLESRVKFQKHKLPRMLEHFDPNKSEVQNMHDNGYHRIFDCGNLVFEKICI